MKICIYEHEIFINTFDQKLLGKAIYGKILRIPLGDYVALSVKLKGTNFNKSCITPFQEVKKKMWNKAIKKCYCIMDLKEDGIYYRYFEELSIFFEEYNLEISKYILKNNSFPKEIKSREDIFD